ncbi:MAG: ATP-dependent carboxylate-amine ligase [Candidatus Aenigmatarchaeota archaeon]|nr:MAG: ATP-dependent carboxylate-amine ligase [Candidatus Aenigmarchaeota archaeon]
MDGLNILITGGGAPGISGTIYSLKNNYDNRNIKLICVDIKKEVVGKYLCDKFYQIPKPTDKAFVQKLKEICKKENVEIILPQVDNELSILAKNKKEFEKIGIKIAISDFKAIKKTNNKYELVQLCKRLGIPSPESYLVSDFKNLVEKAHLMGYPDNKVCIKPPISSGMRGFRILHERDKKDAGKRFYEEKPTGTYTDIEDLYSILGENFPELMIAEHLPGKEYSVDCFRTQEQTIIIPRTRDLIRTGITFNGTIEKNEKIIEYCNKIAEELQMKYCFGFQFKVDSKGVTKIIESNPRIQGTMVMSTFSGANIIYSSIKEALGEKVPDFNIKWGLRFMRCWGGIGIHKDKIEKLDL